MTTELSDREALIKIAVELEAIRDAQEQSRQERREMRQEFRESAAQLKKELDAIRNDFIDNYVTSKELELTIAPLRQISYGLVGSMVTVIVSIILMVANTYFK